MVKNRLRILDIKMTAEKPEQRIYEIEPILKKGTILAEGTLTRSNIPKQMPIIDEEYILIGVIDNASRKVAADIRDEKDYEDFLSTFGGAFITGGRYLVCSVLREEVNKFPIRK